MINEIDLIPINKQVYGILQHATNAEYPILIKGKISRSHYDLFSPKYEVIVERIISSDHSLKYLKKLKNKTNKEYTTIGFKQDFFSLLQNLINIHSKKFTISILNKELKSGLYKVILPHQHITTNLQDLNESMNSFFDVIIEDNIKNIIEIASSPDYNGMYKFVKHSKTKTFLKGLADTFTNTSIGKKDTKELDNLREYEGEYKFNFNAWLHSMWKTYKKFN